MTLPHILHQNIFYISSKNILFSIFLKFFPIYCRLKDNATEDSLICKETDAKWLRALEIFPYVLYYVMHCPLLTFETSYKPGWVHDQYSRSVIRTKCDKYENKHRNMYLLRRRDCFQDWSGWDRLWLDISVDSEGWLVLVSVSLSSLPFTDDGWRGTCRQQISLI